MRQTSINLLASKLSNGICKENLFILFRGRFYIGYTKRINLFCVLIWGVCLRGLDTPKEIPKL